MTDLVTFGESMLRYSSQDNDRLERTPALDIDIAGAESNVAIAAQRLGAEVSWMSKVPDSPLARRLLGPIRSHGVTTNVVFGDGRLGVYYVEQAGEPRGTNVVYDRENAAVTTATIDELPTEILESANMFFSSGITPALSDTLTDTVAELFRMAQSADTRTVFDLNYRSKLWSANEARKTIEGLLEHVDIFFLPERDAQAVLGREGAPESIAEQLDRDFAFDTVILTLGADGAIAYADGDLHRQSAFETDTIDPIGTGDAFVGGYLAERLNEGSIPEALETGAATAALKRTIPGDVAVVSPAEVAAVGDRGDGEISR